MTECSRCGGCCENTWLSVTKRELVGWLTDPERTPTGVANANLVLNHWHRVGGGGRRTRWTCDLLDPETRLCTAHDVRPQICTDFPYYQNATLDPATIHLPLECSYWADVPEELRPTEWVPVTLRR